MRLWNYLWIGALCLILAACGQDKGPAEEAIKLATQAVEQVRAEVSQFAADQFQQLESQLKAAQDSFAKKDYKAALQAASGIPAKAQEVAQAAAAKKAELSKAWDDLNAGIPQMMDAVKSRLDILAQAKKLPDGMAKEKLASLQTSFSEVMAQFEEAKKASAEGAISKAIELGNAAKAKATEIAAGLGLQPQ